VLVIVGLGGVLVATGVLNLATETFVAASIVVMGAALVVGAWWGGSPALLGIGFATAAVLGFLMAANVDLGGGIGDRIYRPASATTVKDRYRLGVGRLWVDLRATNLPPGTSRVATSLGVGELTVVVPDDVRVEASAKAGIGSLLRCEGARRRRRDGARRRAPDPARRRRGRGRGSRVPRVPGAAARRVRQR
jgi:Cell wall-active antibiotics response 4TMS YvqF